MSTAIFLLVNPAFVYVLPELIQRWMKFFPEAHFVPTTLEEYMKFGYFDSLAQQARQLGADRMIVAYAGCVPSSDCILREEQKGGAWKLNRREPLFGCKVPENYDVATSASVSSPVYFMRRSGQEPRMVSFIYKEVRASAAYVTDRVELCLYQVVTPRERTHPAYAPLQPGIKEFLETLDILGL